MRCEILFANQPLRSGGQGSLFGLSDSPDSEGGGRHRIFLGFLWHCPVVGAEAVHAYLMGAELVGDQDQVLDLEVLRGVLLEILDAFIAYRRSPGLCRLE